MIGSSSKLVRLIVDSSLWVFGSVTRSVFESSLGFDVTGTVGKCALRPAATLAMPT